MKALIPTNTAPATRDYSDVMRMLLESKRSMATRKGYGRDIEHFFAAMAPGRPFPGVVNEYLQLDRSEAVIVLLQYRADLQHKGLAPNTINRKLAAVKSLVAFAHRIGQCSWKLDDVQGEKVEAYRDVSGISVAQVAAMLNIPDRGTVKGKRDYAAVRLLWENALRRNEVVACDVGDFDREARTLAITGKGRVQKEFITVSDKTAQALIEWLQARGGVDPCEPLFISLSNYQRGHRMTGTALYNLIDTLAKGAGIPKQMSPHRMRHSAITAALEALNGDVTKVQQLSRHKSIATVMIYADRVKNEQGDVTNLLSALA